MSEGLSGRIAGVWKPHIGGGTPRDFGPCGDVLDQNRPLLFRHLERRYTYFQAVTPPADSAPKQGRNSCIHAGRDRFVHARDFIDVLLAAFSLFALPFRAMFPESHRDKAALS